MSARLMSVRSMFGRSMLERLTGWSMIVCALLACSCSKSEKKKTVSTSEQGASQVSTVGVGTSAASGSASGSASAGAAASAASETAESSVWTGTYEAEQAKLETPEKVKDLTWKNDDGTSSIGKGELSAKVDKDGTVLGQATGVLGEQVLSGTLDGDVLRLRLASKEPTLAMAMTCVGAGKQKDDVFAGEMRCADPKAVVVRAVTFTIKSPK